MGRAALALFIVLAPMAPGGCASSGAVANAPATQGMSHDFPASYDTVKLAAFDAVQQLNVDVQGTDETPERYQIRFARGMSALNWGEVGVVNVVRTGDASTLVVVNREKRSVVHLTSTTDRQFADSVFAHIAEWLMHAERNSGS